MVLLRGTEPNWTFVDRVLTVAYVLSEDMRCVGCGQPKHEAWNPDSEGYYEFHDAICQGCAELHRANEGEREHRPERKVFLIDTRPKDQPLRPWDPLALPVGQVDQDHADEHDAHGEDDRAPETELPEHASGASQGSGHNSQNQARREDPVAGPRVRVRARHQQTGQQRAYSKDCSHGPEHYQG